MSPASKKSARPPRWSTLVLVLACAGGDDRESPGFDAGAAAHRETASSDTGRLAEADRAPGADARISVTAEDSAIFEATLRWARAERLDTLPVGELMARIGRRFVGAPYVPKTLDPPGPERLVVNLRTFDCVTYVESVLALARVIRSEQREFSAFTGELGRIRYRAGDTASYAERLHYFSEWIAANESRGLVRNITADLGGMPDTAAIHFMSRNAELYWQLEDTANLAAIRATERTLSALPRSWVPQERIASVAPGIRNGDVIAATSTVPGLDIAHTGLALWVDGRLHLMHAPLVGSVVEISEVPLAERIRSIRGQDGIMVARPL